MLSWQCQTRNHSSICILDRIRSRVLSHQVNHHLVFQKKKLFLTCELKKVTSFLSMSIPSTLSAIHWPRPSPLLPHSNTTFEFRVGSLGGPSPSTEDQKKRFSLLGIDFWLFRSLLVQLSSSSICLPISSQVRMCVGGGEGEAVRTPFSETRFLGKKTDRMGQSLYIVVLSILRLIVSSFFLFAWSKCPSSFSFQKFQEVKKSSPKTHNNLSPLTSNSTQRANGNGPSIPRRCKSIFPIHLRFLLFRVPSLIPVNRLWVSVSRLVPFSGWRLVVHLRCLHRRIRRVQAPLRPCLSRPLV